MNFNKHFRIVLQPKDINLHGKRRFAVCFSNQNKMSKEVEQLKQALELAKAKLQVAEKALNDIVKWDDDLEDEWGDPGERANSALEKIMILDGF